MKVVLYANTDWYIYNFRLSLVYKLLDEGYDVTIITPRGNYYKKLLEFNLKWIEIPLKRSKYNLGNELYIIIWLFKFLKKNKFKIIHVFTLRCSLQVLISVFFNSKISSIFSVTGLGFLFTSNKKKFQFLQFIVINIIRLFNTNKNSFILQNQEDYDLFTKNLKNKQNVYQIKGSGVDCNKFTNKLIPKSTGNLKVLFCARLLKDKGILEYIESVKIFKKLDLNIVFYISGDLDESNPSSISADDLNAWKEENLINYLGHVHDMNDLYNSVDVLVLPSYREGLSKVLLEASACELSIIASDVPGCNDLIKHNINGLLIQPRNSSQIVDSIKRLYFDEELRLRLGKKARDIVIDEYTVEKVNNLTLLLYKG
jgi:glycosyltransferase involved in cell wall biosynthesis